jgi:hypothetical protein
MDASETKIVIRVLGGVVTDVYASPDLPNFKIIILDYDDEKDFKLEQHVAEAEIDKNQVIQIY